MKSVNVTGSVNIKNAPQYQVPFTINSSTSNLVCYVDNSGYLNCDSVYTNAVQVTGAAGLVMKNGTTTAAGISQSGTVSCAALYINSVLVYANPYYCAGVVAANGTKVTDTGRISYSAKRASTGVYWVVPLTPYPTANYVCVAMAQGLCAYCVIGGEYTNALVPIYVYGATGNVDGIFPFIVY